MCHQKVPRGMRSYCSRNCRIKFSIAYFAPSARYYLYARDRGVCALCGCDTEKLSRVFKRCRVDAQSWVLQALGFGRVHTGSLWQADHIRECARGGWGEGIENYRTLCIASHKRETARLARELAAERRQKSAKMDGSIAKGKR
jgi:hypothetical protein